MERRRPPPDGRKYHFDVIASFGNATSKAARTTHCQRLRCEFRSLRAQSSASSRALDPSFLTHANIRSCFSFFSHTRRTASLSRTYATIRHNTLTCMRISNVAGRRHTFLRAHRSCVFTVDDDGTMRARVVFVRTHKTKHVFTRVLVAPSCGRVHVCIIIHCSRRRVANSSCAQVECDYRAKAVLAGLSGQVGWHAQTYTHTLAHNDHAQRTVSPPPAPRNYLLYTYSSLHVVVVCALLRVYCAGCAREEESISSTHTHTRPPVSVDYTSHIRRQMHAGVPASYVSCVCAHAKPLELPPTADGACVRVLCTFQRLTHATRVAS